MKMRIKKYMALAAAAMLALASPAQSVLSEEASVEQILAELDRIQAEEAPEEAPVQTPAPAPEAAPAPAATPAPAPEAAPAPQPEAAPAPEVIQTPAPEAAPAAEEVQAPQSEAAPAEETVQAPQSEAAPAAEAVQTTQSEATPASEEVAPASEEAAEASSEAQEAVPEEMLEAAETETEALEAAGDEEKEESWTYILQKTELGTPALAGPYTLGEAISCCAPDVTYTIQVIHTVPGQEDQVTTRTETRPAAGSWEYSVGSAGPWNALTTVPDDKSEVYARFVMPEGTLSFEGEDGTSQTIVYSQMESDPVVLNRRYPQLFTPTIAQNANTADYSFSVEGWPGTSVTLTLVNSAGSMIGSAGITISDLPASKNVINHFFSSDWSVNLFGLSDGDFNQRVRLQVTQNPVSGDAIQPCAPFYSNELFLVVPVSGTVSLPAVIHAGDEVSVDLSQLHNPCNLGLYYQWYLGSGDSARTVSGAAARSYTVSIEDLAASGGKVLSCSVTDVLGKTLHTQEVTVLPLDLSRAEVDWDDEAVYTGSKEFPSGISVSVGSYEVPETMWKVAKVRGKNCVNVGSAWLQIKGIGEYVTGSVTAEYKIQGSAAPKKEQPKAAPKAQAQDLTVTDSLGQAKRYEVHVIEEAADAAAQASEGQTEDAVQTVRVYEISTFDDSTREGETVYSQRNLLITSDMIRKAKEAGCSSIRLRVGSGGIDLAVDELTKDRYVVRLAPEDGSGVTEDESRILGQYHPQGEMYRVSVQAQNAQGETADVLDTMLKAKAILYGEHADNIQILLVAYGSLEPAVNDTTQRKSGSTTCLSAGIYQRSLFTGTAVEG